MRKSIKVCDLCTIDGDDDVKAVAWYTAGDKEDYDVCKKHKKEVEDYGLTTHEYDPR